MLSDELLEFLQWLRDQPNPVSASTMEKLSAPNFTYGRIEALRKEKYIDRILEVENDELVSVYSISDKGRAALQEHRRTAREKRVESVRYFITTAIAVAALILAGISLAAQLGLIQLPKA